MANNKFQERICAAQRGELLLDPKYKIDYYEKFVDRYNAVLNAIQASNTMQLTYINRSG